MARKKISEFTAKQLLFKTLALPYRGLSFDINNDKKEKIEKLDPTKKYVVKVDEGVKKRMKNGLVSLNKTPQEIIQEIEKIQKKGYTYFIIEPFVPHQSSSEKYLSFERVRDGITVLYSEKGGIDIEENQTSLQRFIIPHDSLEDIPVEKNLLEKLLKAFDASYFSFLEINPLVIKNEQYALLDVACEVDSSGEFFADGWTAADFRSGNLQKKTEEEDNIAQLSQKSQASFALNVLNPDGSIFMLLSGGGASIVLADEVYNLGFGKQLANYGEYSGNPNAEEVYLYTKNILHLLLASKASQKALVIAGGVANFTDVRITFKGIIKALEEVKEKLQEQQVKVYVRRGGPHQEEGLALMKAFLEKNKLFGAVGDQKIALPEIINEALHPFAHK